MPSSLLSSVLAMHFHSIGFLANFFLFSTSLSAKAVKHQHHHYHDPSMRMITFEDVNPNNGVKFL